MNIVGRADIMDIMNMHGSRQNIHADSVYATNEQVIGRSIYISLMEDRQKREAALLRENTTLGNGMPGMFLSGPKTHLQSPPKHSNYDIPRH